MFSPDVVSLKEFYSSSIGQVAYQQIMLAIRRIWNDLSNDDLIALGYCFPYIEELKDETNLTLPLMPANLGGIYWPANGNNITVIVDEFMLPLVENSINRALIIHACEHTRHVRQMLESIWNILTSGGRALIIVPNRHSFWSQAGDTPFGCGQPFNLKQLKKRVEEQGFTYVRHETSLHMPPINWRLLHKGSKLFELFGRMFFPAFGGVIIMEVEKQIYASIPEPTKDYMKKILYPSTKVIITSNKDTQ